MEEDKKTKNAVFMVLVMPSNFGCEWPQGGVYTRSNLGLKVSHPGVPFYFLIMDSFFRQKNDLFVTMKASGMWATVCGSRVVLWAIGVICVAVLRLLKIGRQIFQ